MKKLKRIIKICQDISLILLFVLLIVTHLVYLLELIDYGFVEKPFQKIGIMNHLRFCFTATFAVIVIHSILNFVSDKINHNN